MWQRNRLAWVVAACMLPSVALADGAEVIVVPYAQSNPILPHPVHQGAPITLKAMIRNAECGYYRVRWDTNRDGDFNDEAERRYGRDSYTRSIRDIGRTFRVPQVTHDSLMNINVRAVSECDGSAHFGTYRLFVHAWEPAADPRLWTEDQVEVLGAIALDEVLWYLHRGLRNARGNHNDVWLRGRPNRSEVGALQIWLNAINDHLPAYPPGLVQGTAEHPLPAGWAAANDRRWRADPYAETSIRLLNDLLTQKSLVTYNIPAEDEDNTCGYDPQSGEALRCARLPGSTDGRGMHVGTTNEGNHGYLQGITLGGLAPILPALAGVALPAGRPGILGQPFEWLIQQMVDYQGYMQIDSGCARGGWYYYNVGHGGCSAADASVMQWSYIGLESAEIAGKAYGVLVNNRHKYRIVDSLVSNQGPDGGSRYRTDRTNGSTYQLTGGALVGARWLGLQHLQRGDHTVAFPGESAHTRDALRQSYDRYLGYTLAEWNSTQRRGNVGWQDGFWRFGDPHCGNVNQLFEVPDRCGNTYALYSFQKGFRTGTPELKTVGVNDWYRQFATYYVRAQRRAIREHDPWWNYSYYGEIWDDYCERTSVTCNYNSRSLTPMMAGLVLTPTIFNAKPFALAEASPAVVTEGCIGGSAGRVRFEHHRSFHPNDDARLIAFQWDVDASNGLWWETGAAPDFEEEPDADGIITGSFEHIYRRAGEYSATLRVVDDLGQWRATRIPVRVNPAANVPPSVTVGGPYYVEVGQPVQLDSVVDDINLGCGDTVSVTWDLDGDGLFDDAEGENPLVPFEVISGLPLSVPQVIRLKATDSGGLSSETTATLVVFPRDPVARMQVHPNPAACGQAVTFDGTGSHHPDPRRQVVQYTWDVDGQPGADGGGPVFRRAFDRFGTWPVSLRVVDDLGREDTAVDTLAVTLGNRPPVARVEPVPPTPDDVDLILDGSGSYDPDFACGDAVVAWRWDVNGDGDFDDPIDAQGPRPTLSQATLAAVIGHGTRTLTLQVEDRQGARSTRNFQITILPSAPVPVVLQRPDPGTVHEAEGRVELQLDGRASFSQLPETRIRRIDWDLNDNGWFELWDRPQVVFTRQLVPPINVMNLPELWVRMRVTDTDNRVAIARVRLNVVVGPAPPTAIAHPGAPSADPAEQGYHALVGEPLVLDASGSLDPNGDAIVVYRWDLDHDPEAGFETDVLVVAPELGAPADPQTTVSPETLAEHGMDQPGTYVIGLQARDETGLTGQGTTTVTLYAPDPVVVLDDTPLHVAPGEPVVFDASGSHHPHPGIDVVEIRWDLDGDGVFDDAEGPVVEHRFDHFTFEDPITVSVQITDSAGNQSTASVPVQVDQGNRPPDGVAGGTRDEGGAVVGPYVIVVGEPLQLSAAGSQDPDGAAGDEIVEYRWDLDRDGTPDLVSAGPEPAPVPWAALVGEGISQPGVYPILLTVEDRFGETSTASANVLVIRGPQAHVAAPTRAYCGEAVVLDGRGSTTDGPAHLGYGLVEYAWDLNGDGEFDDATGARVTIPAIAFAALGALRLNVVLRVTDGLGNVAYAERFIDIDVQNQAPTAVAGGPYSTGPHGDSFVPVLLDGRASFDPDGPCDAVVSYQWDLDGDGIFGAADGEPEGALVEFVDPTWQPGTSRTVALRVCDALGACSQPATAVIEVLRTAPPAGAVATPTPEDCVGAGDFSVTVDVSHPEGARLNVAVFIANRKVAESLDLPTRIDGQAVRVALPVNVAQIPEGRHDVIVQLTDPEGGHSTVRSPGKVTFDRTAPDISIGAALGAEVCYHPGHVPNPQISAVDGLDPSPRIDESVDLDTCARTLTVTATDACGNQARDTRSYLIAEAPAMLIDGPPDGSRVATARYTWSIDGNPGCVSAISATVMINGRSPQPYPEGSVLDEPGQATVTVRVANCMGMFREQTRWVRINHPPVAVPVPDNGGVLGDPSGARYVVREGDPLMLDGSRSRPPEDDDQIMDWRWDFTGNGQFTDAQGAQVAFSTQDDGIFDVALRVTDDLGATGTETVRVRVIDVSPVAHAGGPYRGVQGREVHFDGSQSHPGSWADPIHSYRWNFGDGVVDEGALLVQPSHLYEHDGWYEVSLTVFDEDNSAEDRVAIYVEDVDPIIHRVILPEDPREFAQLSFTVEASPGAPGDPITRYEWDFDGDGQFDYGSATGSVSTTWYRDAGEYPMRVRVRDPDSYAEVVVPVSVREATFAEVIEWTGERVVGLRDGGTLSPFQRLYLHGIEQFVRNGLWGERWGRRGNTLLAVERLVMQIRSAVGLDADLGLELWALSRQQYREILRTRDALLMGPDSPGAGHASIQRAQDWIRTMGDLFNGPSFWDACHDPNRQGIAQEVWNAGYEAYFWLTDSTDHCAQDFDGFAMPNVADPVARSQAANTVNERLQEALYWLKDEVDTYLWTGAQADDWGPGWLEATQSNASLAELIRLVSFRVGSECNEVYHRCITDTEALDLLLEGVTLVRRLSLANAYGVYTRNWQSCVMTGVRFRTELSILRTEFACGRHHWTSQRVRALQSIGLGLVNQGRIPEALDFYGDPELQCVMREVYNQCLVSRFPVSNRWRDYPQTCLNHLTAGPEQPDSW